MVILGGTGGAWQGAAAASGAGDGAAWAADGGGLQGAAAAIGMANGRNDSMKADDVTEGEGSAEERSGSGDQPTQAEGQGSNPPEPDPF